VVAVSLLAAAAAGAVLSCNSKSADPAASPAAMTPEQKVVRGRYLLVVLGCNDCHTPGGMYGTPDSTRALSGSELGWRGPWGVTYPRNITPDSTGIAGWTEDQIVTAIRQGRRPDGTPILPPMPWPTFARLTDEDAGALAAALKALPPIAHRSPAALPPSSKPGAHELIFPPPPAWDLPSAHATQDTTAKRS
jgi:mono/diheme cytochrome c family protein